MATLAIPRRHATTSGLGFGWARALGGGIGAAADGLTVGLVIAYVSLAAFGAPANYLGVPDPVAILLVGVMVAGVAAVAAVAALGVRQVVRVLTRWLSSLDAVAGRPRLTWLMGLPERVLRGIPIAWLAAFGALLWIVLVGQETVAPVALLVPPGSTVPYLYLIGVVGAGLGLAAHLVRTRRDGRLPGPPQRWAGGTLVVLSAVLLVAGTSLAWWPGAAAGSAPPASLDGQLVPTRLADPGASGPFDVERLTYGSGEDARRPAFGVDVDLTTSSIDASQLLLPLAPGADAARSWFWGFDTTRLPVQGLAWLPVGDGPFPLVLIAHGNHAMGDFSESGYTYLGEHLASRGFAAASIDEDFLNGSWADDYHGNEQLVRAWLLLVHLDAWRAWSAPGGPLAGRIDLDRVALIGHSRGGEAASVAASLSSAATPPRPGMTPWPTGLDIDAVVSIAPSDGQFTGALRLEGVDFLTLQGGWDADARAWSGIRQYARTTLGADGFAAGMWVYRANHGQFNEVWGKGDFGPFSPAILDLAPLISAAEQRDVAKTAIGAFLEASLHDEDAYRGLFRRPMVGREWLPADVIVVRSKSGESVGLTSGSPDRPIDGLTVTTAGATVRTRSVPLRALQPDQVTRGTLMTWNAGSGAASWTLDGLDGILGSGRPPTALRLVVADGRAPDPTTTTPLPVTVVATAGGAPAAVPLDRFGALPPPLPVRLAKHDLLAALAGIDLSVRSASEIVLQTYEIPLSAFADTGPSFDPARLSAISIEVARTGSGAIWITEPALVR